MADNALSESLEIVVERVGNPAPQIYQRMFKQSPELEPMFVLDRDGHVLVSHQGQASESQLRRWIGKALEH